jgi:homocysteine S-methyltransferase
MFSCGILSNETVTTTEIHNPLQPFLDTQGFLVLDGGLATELEARGCDIDDELWSAKVLLEDPDLIRSVHHDYLGTGADCIMSASYQATVEGFERRGLSKSAAFAILEASVRLAIEARDSFWEIAENRVDRIRPLVAASIGPYGAFLADGSEYDGRYGLTCDELASFHRERWHLLVESGADIMACETIPSNVETLALTELLRETADIMCLFSFSCRNAEQLYDGSRLANVIQQVSELAQIVAVGVNCVPPSLVPALIRSVRSVTDKPVAVYPNSGEKYDAFSKTWSGVADPVDFGEAAKRWHDLGARILGGCCRTGPEHVRAIRVAMGR